MCMNEWIVRGLSLDSRRVNPGDLFIAIPGVVTDGRQHIAEAIQRGAVAVLAEALYDFDEANDQLKSRTSIPVIVFPDLKSSVSAIAGRFFSEPSSDLKVIGITGTNGKTTCAHMIAHLISTSPNHACAVMGTLGNGFLESRVASNCTTPDPILVQQQLATFREAHATSVAMEVTSHALIQWRVAGVHFHTAIFTNLTHDHLDYHGTMEHYFEAKKRLFLDLNPIHAIVNLDDPYGRQLVRAILDNTTFQKRGRRPNIIGYTLYPTLLEIPLEAGESIAEFDNLIKCIITQTLEFSEKGFKAQIHSPWGAGEIDCPLFGRFNVRNSLAALAAACLQVIPFDVVSQSFKTLKTISGRMSVFGGQDEPMVVVDYAHTPDALEQVLLDLRERAVARAGHLWCVFGCGGDRDAGKRSIMGQIAAVLSDYVVLTDDNPRTEHPEKILEAIKKGIQSPLVSFCEAASHREKSTTPLVMVERNRRLAIQNTILAAHPFDVIVIAGRGHEDYQIIGIEKIPLNDENEALRGLTLRRETAKGHGKKSYSA